MHIDDQELRRAEWLARLLVPPAVAGLMLAGIYVSALFDEPPGWSWTLVLVVVVQVYIIAEGVRFISRWLRRRLPGRERLGRRLLLQMLASLLFACGFLLLIYVPVKLSEIANGSNDELGWPHLAFTLLVGLAFGVTLSLLQGVFDLLREWQQVAVEAERLRRAGLRAELDAVKAQINPHFLFNSLNTLYGLIQQSPDQAQALLLELSDVFRYVLHHGEHDLVPLTQELEFLTAYMRILSARHGTAVRLEIGALGAIQDVSVPPMCLQLLIENAVRHNRVDAQQPLVIRIERVRDRLVVRNPQLPKRGTETSTGIGLSNLDARYRLLGAPALGVRHEGENFEVALPLLTSPRSSP
jgi:sensor histidine kinase YesM